MQTFRRYFAHHLATYAEHRTQYIIAVPDYVRSNAWKLAYQYTFLEERSDFNVRLHLKDGSSD